MNTPAETLIDRPGRRGVHGRAGFAYRSGATTCAPVVFQVQDPGGAHREADSDHGRRHEGCEEDLRAQGLREVFGDRFYGTSGVL